MLFLEMELDKKRAALESDLLQKRKDAELQGRSTQDGKLCATPFGVDVARMGPSRLQSPCPRAAPPLPLVGVPSGRFL